MATTLPAERTQHARNNAQNEMAVDHVQRIDGPSRIVDRDIETLQMNLVQLHDGRYEARSTAWERLESAWETVRAELADDNASSPLTGGVSPGNGAAVAVAEVDAPMAVVPTVPLAMKSLNWVTGVLGPAISSRSQTGRALVTRARPPCGTRCRGVEGPELRQQRSVGRCEACEQWVVWVGRGRQKTSGVLGEHVVTPRRQMADMEGRQVSVCRDRSFRWHDRILFTGRRCERFAATTDAPAADLPNTGSDLATFAQKVGPADVTHRGTGSTNLAQGNAGGAYSTAWKEPRRRAWKARRRR